MHWKVIFHINGQFSLVCRNLGAQVWFVPYAFGTVAENCLTQADSTLPFRTKVKNIMGLHKKCWAKHCWWLALSPLSFSCWKCLERPEVALSLSLFFERLIFNQNVHCVYLSVLEMLAPVYRICKLDCAVRCKILCEISKCLTVFVFGLLQEIARSSRH